MARYRGNRRLGTIGRGHLRLPGRLLQRRRVGPGTCVRAERLDDGPLALGAVFRLEVRVGTRVTPLDYRVVAYDRPHRVVLLGRERHRPLRGHRHRGADGRTADRCSPTTPTSQLIGGLAVVNPLLLGAVPPDRRPGRWPGSASVLSGRRRPGHRRPPAGPGRHRGRRGARGSRWWAASPSIGPAVRSRTAGWRTPPVDGGRRVLVTGATSGLGLATAMRRGPPRRHGGSPARSRRPGRAGRAPPCDEAAPVSTSTICWPTWASSTRSGPWPSEFLAGHDRLDVLVHNAGALTRQYTTDRRASSSPWPPRSRRRSSSPACSSTALRAAAPVPGRSRSRRAACTPSGSTSPR